MDLPLLLLLLLSTLLPPVALALPPFPTASHPSSSQCQPPLFVFGASMVDTGENAAAMPLRSVAESPPYGLHYFGRPAARFSNGRVFMDFISQGLGYGLLDPYLKSLNSNFARGVNFASSGSTARNTTVRGNGTDNSGLFSLSVQVAQFKEFRDAVFTSQSQSGDCLTTMPSRKQFPEAIYFIETAHNDYITTAFKERDFDALAFVTEVISAMEISFKALYDLGARNIIVMNITPLGCTPAILSDTPPEHLDEYGCNYVWNDLVSLHNRHVEILLERLRPELPLGNWIEFDAYSLMLDAYRNPSKYGVKYPFEACCGFRQGIGCGKSGSINGTIVEAKSCEDPSLHIIWDTIHPADPFGHFIAEGVLSGSYLRPYLNIKGSCLNTSKLAATVV